MQAIMETRTGENLAADFAPNSSRVPEILGWYGSDNPGTLTNIARLLNLSFRAGDRVWLQRLRCASGISGSGSTRFRGTNSLDLEG